MLTNIRSVPSLGCALAFALSLVAHAPAQAANPLTTITLSPIVEANGNDSDFDTHWDTIDPWPNVLLAYNGLPSAYNYRVALEFDVAAIPASATIVDATVHVHYNGSSGNHSIASLQFNSYAGNGAIDVADFQQVNQIGPLSLLVPPAPGQWFHVPVTDRLQSIIDQSESRLGIMIQNVVTNQTAFLSSAEPDPAVRPYLSITFDIPEPIAAALLFLGGLCALVASNRLRR